MIGKRVEPEKMMFNGEGKDRQRNVRVVDRRPEDRRDIFRRQRNDLRIFQQMPGIVERGKLAGQHGRKHAKGNRPEKEQDISGLAP